MTATAAIPAGPASPDAFIVAPNVLRAHEMPHTDDSIDAALPYGPRVRRDEVADYRLDMAITGPAEAAGAAAVAKPAPAKVGTLSKDEQACPQAVSTETNNGDVLVLSSETSEANDDVVVGMGPNLAPGVALSPAV